MGRLIYALITIILIFSRASYASSKQHIDRINSRQHQQQSNLNKQIKSQQLKPTNVRLEASKYDNLDFPLNESPCFKINKITIVDYDPEKEAENEALLVKRKRAGKRAGKKAGKTAEKKVERKAEKSKFEWILKAIYQDHDFALPACIGSRGINVLLRRMQNYLIDEGYVTTRVVVSSQDLRSGELVFTVIAGKINRIQLQDLSESPYASRATLYFAMPVSDGDLLNLHSIEQGLENLNRIPSAEAKMTLEATDKVGESDVIINYKQNYPMHLTLSLDDSGSKATGRLQGTLTLSLDNILKLNDMFYLSGTRGYKRHSDDADGDHGSRNISAYYSIPFKNYALTLSGSVYNYYQTIAGAFEPYEYSGESKQMQATLSRALFRSNNYKTFISLGLWARESKNYVNDTEVEVQRRRTAGWTLGINHTQFIENGTLQIGFNYKRGTGARNSLPAPEEELGGGTSRPQIYTLNVDFTYPWLVGEQILTYGTSISGQYNGTPLTQQDKFTIGGRYTVRGFDGELSLAGNSGVLWRNDFGWNIFSKGQELYLGLDYGHVYSDQDELQVGNSLTGGVVGIRGSILGLNYDLFVGMPIFKPRGFRTNRVVTGFNFSYRL